MLYLICPNCGRKRVYFKAKRDKRTDRPINCYRCKGCRWYAFTNSREEGEQRKLYLLGRVNPPIREMEEAD